MSNCCSTDIYINHEDNEKLKELYNKIEYWISKNWTEGKTSRNWLGNVIEGSGIGSWEDYRCRGHIDCMDLSDGQLSIYTETAWSPMVQMWQAVVDKYLPDAEVIFVACESGCDVFCTNDPYYIGKWYVDIYDEDIYYDWTREQVIEWLQSVLNTKETNMQKLLKMMYETDEEIGSVHRWNYVDISEVD